MIGCFFIKQSSYTWREEWRTNNVKAKTCLFTGQVDVQHMPFTYVTLYNPDSLGNNLILAITNFETENKTNKPKKNVLYNTSWTAPFRPLKETANIRWTTISAQILHDNNTKWRVARKRKTGGAAKHSLKQTADSTVPQSQIVWTIEPLNQKSQKSQIAQEYGLLPADARQQLLNVFWIIRNYTISPSISL